MRMEEDELIKRIVGSDARSERLRGTPQMGWMDGVERVLNDRDDCRVVNA